MNKVFGNYDIQNRMKSYLKQEQPNGVTFLGPKGIGKSLLATNVAACLLACDVVFKLSYHPDFVRIEPVDGSVKVEQINDLQRIISYFPLSASRRVILIDDANTMTVPAQNSLLKVLEDKQQYNIFLLVAHDSLLPTIHSRTITAAMKNLSPKDMILYLRDQGIMKTDIPFFLNVCDGSIGTYHRFTTDDDMLHSFKTCMDYFEQCSLRDVSILKLLHVYKEKDNLSFYELYKEEMQSFLGMLTNLFYGLFLSYTNSIEYDCNSIDYSNMRNNFSLIDTVRILDCIKNHRRLSKNNSYSKNDFFDLIRALL